MTAKLASSSSAPAPKKAKKVSPTAAKIPEQDSSITIVNDNVILSMAAGLVPVPGIDIAAITGIQVKLVADLAKKYGVPFKEDMIKGLVVGLLAGAGTALIGRTLAASAAKFIPFIGTAAGMIAVPVTAGAATYAVGRIFVNHFEAGGTLINFDSDKAKEHYTAFFEEGKKIAADFKDAAKAI